MEEHLTISSIQEKHKKNKKDDIMLTSCMNTISSFTNDLAWSLDRAVDRAVGKLEDLIKQNLAKQENHGHSSSSIEKKNKSQRKLICCDCGEICEACVSSTDTERVIAEVCLRSFQKIASSSWVEDIFDSHFQYCIQDGACVRQTLKVSTKVKSFVFTQKRDIYQCFCERLEDIQQEAIFERDLRKMLHISVEEELKYYRQFRHRPQDFDDEVFEDKRYRKIIDAYSSRRAKSLYDNLRNQFHEDCDLFETNGCIDLEEGDERLTERISYWLKRDFKEGQQFEVSKVFSTQDPTAQLGWKFTCVKSIF